MIKGSFGGLKVSGIAAALPTKCVKSEDYSELFGDDTVRKIVASTGVQSGYYTVREQTASDLAYAAALNLFKQKMIDPESVGILIFACSHPDYMGPATAFVLHKRLKMSENCIAFDVNLNCSAVPYGLYVLASMLTAGSASRGLLLIGDTTTKVVSPYDTSRLLFGDAGTAILLEKTKEDTSPIHIGVKADGRRYKAILTPGGGFRNLDASHEMRECEDGILRSDYNVHMNGMDVFSFAMTDVPILFDEFMKEYNISSDDVDALVLHQANRFIIRHLVKKIGIEMDKVPISLDRYGNTSGASIPVTLSDAYGNMDGKKLKLMLSGFGVGLSWGVASLTLDTSDVLPIIHTDEYYSDETQ